MARRDSQRGAVAFVASVIIIAVLLALTIGVYYSPW
jgi:hypothetical protein